MNREQRRHPEERTKAPAPSPAEQIRDADRPQDTLDPRAKSAGHGKKTADEWNQQRRPATSAAATRWLPSVPP